MKKSRYKEGLLEIKNSKGDNEIRITENGRITYRTTEGYKNKSDMRQTAVNNAVLIIREYAEMLDEKQINAIQFSINQAHGK